MSVRTWIAYSLSDEAVNPLDLITGTEHLNHDVMAKFEDQIRDYLNAGYTHKRHVLMRVTPDFRGDDLVARGVQIEALSLEDNGASVCLNVYCYNIQPGVVIDYVTGKSRLGDPSTNNPLANNAKTNEQAQESTSAAEAIERSHVLNTNTKRFHYPDCSSVDDMKAKNRSNVTDTPRTPDRTRLQTLRPLQPLMPIRRGSYLFSFAFAFDWKRSLSTMKRSCVPRPTIPCSSTTSTSKESARPSTFTNSLLQETSIPMGVGAS